MEKDKRMSILEALGFAVAALIFASMAACLIRDLRRAKRDEMRDLNDEYEVLCRTLAEGP